jgi:uncharacterized protein (TIGR02266 family)
MSRTTEEAEITERMVDRGTEAANVLVSAEPEPQLSAAPAAPVAYERRAKPRYTVHFSVTLAGDNNFYLGISENLSEGGLFVRTQKVLSIGTRIEMDFVLPTSAKHLSVTGVVRWVRSPDAVREEYNNYGSVEDANSKPGLGLQFEELSPEVSHEIAKFIRYRKPEFYDD